MRRDRQILTAAIFGAIMLLSSRSVFAAENGVRVGEIVIREISGETLADDGFVRQRIAIRAGDTVNAIIVANDQRKLMESGHFSSVRILSEPTADGTMRLIYEVERVPAFQAPLTIVGNRKFSRGKISGIINLSDGQLIDPAELSARCDKLRDEYRTRGYYDVVIRPEIEKVGKGRVKVTINIEEGIRRKLVGFEFAAADDEQPLVFKAAELREALKQPGSLNPVWFLFSAWRKEAVDFGGVIDSLSTFYFDKGYLDAKISAPVWKPVKVGGEKYLLRVVIDEGIKYKVGGQTIKGCKLFSAAELQKIVEFSLPQGVEANKTKIAQAARSLRDFYGARGYVDTYVEPTILPRGDTVEITYNIEEGQLAYVRSIIIRGNSRTRDKVIRREIRLNPGEVLNEVQAERNRKILENLGYFETVRYSSVPSFDRGERPLERAYRDLVYEVSEKNTGQFMVGVGFNTIDKVLGFAEVSQTNFDLFNWPTFMGGGQKFSASFQVAEDSNSAEISITEPWFLDRRLSLTLEAYRREHGYTEYDETRIGGGASITLPIRYGRLSFRYSLEKFSMDDVLTGTYTDELGVPYAFTDEVDDATIGKARLSWLYDTRDHPFVPTRGIRTTLFGEVADSATGSDFELFKAGIDTRVWIPLWFGHVISARVRAEGIDSYGDTEEVPISERLYLGGARTVRGFKYRDIGPKVFPGEDRPGRAHPLGGKTLAMASLEYTVPVAKILRLAAFYDAGNVWSDAFDLDFSEYAASWGFGLRLDIPGFPMRFDYAVPTREDDDYSRHERFTFSLGFD